MQKTDREKLVVEVNLKYIESLDREATIGFWIRISAVGAVIAFLITNNLFSLQVPTFLVFILTGVFIIYLLNSNSQYIKYTDDLYYDLIDSIKKNKIMGFKIKSWKWHNSNFWYRKRHK